MFENFRIKYWNDPVWSKIIAAFVIFISTIIYTYFNENRTAIESYFIFSIILLIVILLYIIRHKNIVIKYLNYYDRKYELIKIHNKYTLNKNGNLDLIQFSERKMECTSGEIKKFIFGPGSDLGIYDREFTEIPIAKISKSN